jgi:hypothetical protein
LDGGLFHDYNAESIFQQLMAAGKYGALYSTCKVGLFGCSTIFGGLSLCQALENRM